jgi:hypothetical protein
VSSDATCRDAVRRSESNAPDSPPPGFPAGFAGSSAADFVWLKTPGAPSPGRTITLPTREDSLESPSIPKLLAVGLATQLGRPRVEPGIIVAVGRNEVLDKRHRHCVLHVCVEVADERLRHDFENAVGQCDIALGVLRGGEPADVGHEEMGEQLASHVDEMLVNDRRDLWAHPHEFCKKPDAVETVDVGSARLRLFAYVDRPSLVRRRARGSGTVDGAGRTPRRCGRARRGVRRHACRAANCEQHETDGQVAHCGVSADQLITFAEALRPATAAEWDAIVAAVAPPIACTGNQCSGTPEPGSIIPAGVDGFPAIDENLVPDDGRGATYAAYSYYYSSGGSTWIGVVGASSDSTYDNLVNIQVSNSEDAEQLPVEPGRTPDVGEYDYVDGVELVKTFPTGIAVIVQGRDIDVLYRLLDNIEPATTNGELTGYELIGDLPDNLIELERPYERGLQSGSFPVLYVHNGTVQIAVNSTPALSVVSGWIGPIEVIEVMIKWRSSTRARRSTTSRSPSSSAVGTHSHSRAMD